MSGFMFLRAPAHPTGFIEPCLPTLARPRGRPTSEGGHGKPLREIRSRLLTFNDICVRCEALHTLPLGKALYRFLSTDEY